MPIKVHIKFSKLPKDQKEQEATLTDPTIEDFKEAVNVLTEEPKEIKPMKKKIKKVIKPKEKKIKKSKK